MCTFFRKSCTENAAGTTTHRDIPLDMLHARRASAVGIVFALLEASDLTKDGTACSAGEINHGTRSDY
jgi:hypothetical protein